MTVKATMFDCFIFDMYEPVRVIFGRRRHYFVVNTSV